MISAIIIFVSSFLGIAAKSFQSLNVKDLNFKMIPYGSYAIALCDALVITSFVVTPEWWMFIFAGTGGTLGCWITMYFYKKSIDNKIKILNNI